MTLGAHVGRKSGQSWPTAIAEFEGITKRRLTIRRVFHGSMPSSFDNTGMVHDLGKRKSVFSFKPPLTTTPEEFDKLAQSFADSGHPMDVIMWHEPIDNMSGPDFVSIFRIGAPHFRRRGIRTGVVYSGWPVRHRRTLASYWPGRDVVDFLAIDEYSPWCPFPAETYLTTAAQFADAQGVEFGVAEFGMEATGDDAIAVRNAEWFRSLTNFAQNRKAAGRPLRWMLYFHDLDPDAYSWWLDNRVEYVDAYRDAWDIFSR